MDELVVEYNGNDIEISHVVLNQDKDIKLLRGFKQDKDNKKKYMRNFVIMIGDEFVTSNIADSMLLKEELFLFNQGDIQNKYFFPSTRKLEQESVNSLVLTLENGRKIYISKSEARAIVALWNMSMQGYSFSRLLEYEKAQTLETWTVALELNGYLQLELKVD